METDIAPWRRFDRIQDGGILVAPFRVCPRDIVVGESGVVDDDGKIVLACFVNDLAGEVVVDVAMAMPDVGWIVAIAEMVLGKEHHHLRPGARDRLDDLRRRPVMIQFFARHLPFRIMGVDKSSAREFRDIDRHGALGWFKVTCNYSGRMRPAAPEIRDNHRRRLPRPQIQDNRRWRKT